MLFCTQQYLIFFLLVFAVYWAMPWPRFRVWLLLTASVYFYASWNKWLALIVFTTSCCDYLLALGMDATRSERLRKLLLLISVVGNLGLLCYFKYANFFLQSLQEALQAAGARLSLPVLQVIVPVGISFYTFEAINYTVEVYRRRIPAERNLANFLLFILFFPHLVAGPIVRAADFLPQIRRDKEWSWFRAHLGLRLILLGLVKKMVIADHLALYVDPVFADPELYRSSTLWRAAIAYALQVYCDFSGYSDLALGSAHLLGYRLVQNFNMPFLAANITEFWRRWHISLSTWIRDYVFIPLGGSRGSLPRTCLNLILAMTLCGLWHGAAWTFVAFGLIQGILLSVHLVFRRHAEHWPRLTGMLLSIPGTAFRIAVTFLIFCLSLVVFRATSLSSAGFMLQRMILPDGSGAGFADRLSLLLLFVLVALGHLLGAKQQWFDWYNRMPAGLRGFGYAAAVMIALLLAAQNEQAFVYFQF